MELFVINRLLPFGVGGSLNQEDRVSNINTQRACNAFVSYNSLQLILSFDQR
jgi:hypothetical protein